jgi:hypothetical protein
MMTNGGGVKPRIDSGKEHTQIRSYNVGNRFFDSVEELLLRWFPGRVDHLSFVI